MRLVDCFAAMLCSNALQQRPEDHLLQVIKLAVLKNCLMVALVDLQLEGPAWTCHLVL